MPKIYFYDLGLRNFFTRNFLSFEEREDRGALLEGATFRELRKTHEEEAIRFWRTAQKNEVDFIVNEKEAFEVKTRATEFKDKKYKTFFENYPDIKFTVVTIDKKAATIGAHKVFNVWEI